MSAIETLPDIANYQAKLDRFEQQQIDRLPLPNLETMPSQLVEVANRIENLTGTWNPVELFTPDNLTEEKKKFLDAYGKGDEYNPQFNYLYANNFQLGNSREELEGLLRTTRQFTPINTEERIARIALYFKVKDDLSTVSIVEGMQGILTEDEKKQEITPEQKIGMAIREKYPPLTGDALLWELAQKNFKQRLNAEKKEIASPQGMLTVKEIEYLEKREFKAEEIKDAYSWALDQYGMLRTEGNPEGFAVEIDKETTSIDVRDKSENGATVFIPEDKVFTGVEFLQNMAHEIEGHARQSINGKRLFLLGGGKLKIDNEMLYEGLGKRYDSLLSKELFGNEEEEPLPYYTYAVKAAEAEEGSSFHDIFHQMLTMHLQVELQKKNPEEIPSHDSIDAEKLNKAIEGAWKTTYRVMRGHLDTTNPDSFAMTKDLAYLRGYHIDRQLRQEGIGFLNESGVIDTGALQLLAEYSIEEKDLPLPYKNVAREYCEKLLESQMTT